MEKELELRLYGLVPYQLTGIQQGIQFGHSAIEYAVDVIDILLKSIIDAEIIKVADTYITWARKYKTFIILNGGTTNTNEDKLGTLNQHLQTLKDNNIFCSSFYEPDLGDQLTAVNFLVDERVFNKEDYPDFEDWFVANKNIELDDKLMWRSPLQVAKEIKFSDSEKDIKTYQEWVDFVGGEKNVFLREFLKQFRLA
jgi:hypothetical protein